ncbi:MAG: hypothetical protein FWC60_09800 [Firmicutes bacterium]|nr:hypothetical protein [Bacillota bacterium]
MKLIDRLLFKVQRDSGELKLAPSFVRFDADSQLWTAVCNLWNGRKGAGIESITTQHKSQEEAVTAAEAVAAQYPGRGPIIYGTEDLTD